MYLVFATLGVSKFPPKQTPNLFLFKGQFPRWGEETPETNQEKNSVF